MSYGRKEWKELSALNKKVLDEIEFPKPDQGEDLNEYLERVESQYATLVLPPELKGFLFNFMDNHDLAEYLEERYGWAIREEIRYYIWF